MQLENILQKIDSINTEYIKKAKNKTSKLIMPYRAMGFLHTISEQICGITRNLNPNIEKAALFIMVGDHGVVEEGVSQYPQSITLEMVKSFIRGKATSTVLTKSLKIKTIITDIGMKENFQKPTFSNDNIFYLCRKIKAGTNNFRLQKAMSISDAEKSIKTGFEITDKFIKKYNINLIATGDMGIGNTTPSTAIASVILEKDPREITGRGSLIDGKTLERKIEIIDEAIKKHNPNKKDGIDVLSKIGGFEIGGLTGVILAGCYNKIPIIIDGVVSTAAALIATTLKKEINNYLLAGHLSSDKSHKYMLEYLKLK
ncbi:MAG: nicotinate-nucleotide--dimethylbenzimidazole phosphoribosyltransferase, partial [Deferribacterota bacterium]|nr:nicotinate-nucleotide--dimethylbenzimidazole phosphoribosyltransferase [Deferribacterota bacterium]